jgi:hypothetical protein
VQDTINRSIHCSPSECQDASGPTLLFYTEGSAVMKRSWELAILLVAALAFAISASAQSEGAVKVPFDPDVGWVILNTTAGGMLNATAHVQNGLINEDFLVNVRVRYEDGTVDEHVEIATLSTNGEGNGNVELHVSINPPPGSTTLRRVAFRLRRPGPPNVLYLAVAWDIPLK